MGYDRTFNEYGYWRIGVYFQGHHGKPQNFCDIHMWGPPDTLFRNIE